MPRPLPTPDPPRPGRPDTPGPGRPKSPVNDPAAPLGPAVLIGPAALIGPAVVTDPADRRLDDYRDLTDAAARRNRETRSGLFVLEGAKALRQAVESGWPLRSVLLVESKAEAMADVVAHATRRAVPVYLTGQATFDGIAGFHVHRGVLALAERPAPRPLGSVLEGARAVVVLEGVNDHENLGAVFRNAAALGAGAVVMDPTTCDPLYRRAVRVSVGHVLRVPYARIEPWPAALSTLVGAGLRLLALTPNGDTSLERIEVGPPYALLLGSEGSGLSDAALAEVARLGGVTVRIPMRAGTDSLNVATAAAVALYHLDGPAS